MLKILLILFLLLSQAHASITKNLKQVGTSQLYWTFFKVYDIALYNHNGRYSQGTYPMALVIRYARTIDKNDLIASTEEEWKKQNLTWNPDWIEQLHSIWPTVKEDDELMLYVDKAQISYFYYNDKLLGEINDPLFANTFASIWLSENTSQPKLRHELIGNTP